MQGEVGVEVCDQIEKAAKGTPAGCVQHRVGRLRAGAFFGEIGLLTGRQRGATIVCRTPVECVVLDRREFDALFPPGKDIVTYPVVDKVDGNVFVNENSSPSFRQVRTYRH